MGNLINRPPAAGAIPLENEEIQNMWDLSVEDLAKLMGQRHPDEKLRILASLGGLDGLAEAVGSNLDTGLPRDQGQVHIRKLVYGENVFPEPPQSTIWQNWVEAIQDVTLIILLVAALVSLIVGIAFPPKGEEATSWIEGAAILVAVLAVSITTAVLDYIQEGKFREMNRAEGAKPVTVVRGGEPEQILISELVVGDVVVLSNGDQVPADGFVIQADDLTVDASTMTGETDSVKKLPGGERSFLLCGCYVDNGIGRMLVGAVGKRTEWGKMLEEIDAPREPTPLQEKLDEMAESIGWGGLGVAIAVFVVLMVYWVVKLFSVEWQFSLLREVMDAFIIAVTIVVVAVPEGLPLAVTISLAYSMKQMWDDQNLVRHLRASETMGGATNICSDKTGTLTENRMTVTRGWIAGQQFDRVPLGFVLHPAVQGVLFQHIAVNSTANIVPQPDGTTKYLLNKTECALLLFSERMGHNYRDLRAASPRTKMWPFSSTKKKMSVLVPDIFNAPNTSGSTSAANGLRLHTKGAPEIVLASCTSIFNADGSTRDLTTADRDALLELQTNYARMGLRTLALATRTLRDFDSEPEDDGAEGQAQGQGQGQGQGQTAAVEAPDFALTFLALFGIEDPIRQEVPDAVSRCRTAGVTVRMVTGDNIETAKKIASDAGILTHDGIAIEGPDFANLTLPEIDRILPRLQVLARCSPQDKLRLVLRLRDHKEIVAVTGDGTNDGPALKQANVGLAMGIAGTDIAQKSSDIVILDDNFASVVKALSWGRCIFDNIRKFLQFQLTVNLAALIVAFIGAVTQKGSPMRAIQLLWINLIMDTLAALALGTERPTPELLDRPPINIQKAWLISNVMIKNMIGQALYQVAILLFMLYLGPYAWKTTDMSLHHYTLIFNAFVWSTIWNEINCRKVNGEQNIFSGLFTNWVFVAVISFTIGAQILIVQFGGHAFQTAPLSAVEWLETMLIGFGAIPVGIIVRMIPVPKYDGFGFSDREQYSYPEDREYNSAKVHKSLLDVSEEERSNKSTRNRDSYSSGNFDKAPLLRIDADSDSE